MDKHILITNGINIPLFVTESGRLNESIGKYLDSKGIKDFDIEVKDDRVFYSGKIYDKFGESIPSRGTLYCNNIDVY